MLGRGNLGWLLGLLAVVGCGRTGLDLGLDDGVVDDGLDGGEVPSEPLPDDSADGGELPPEEPPPPVDPPPDPSCGNGIVEPGELCFMPQVTFWSRIDPCALDVADIDFDGHLDVVAPNSDFDHAESELNLTSVLYGNGLGQLGEPVPYVSGDDIPVGVRIGDVDHSSTPDLVVVNSDAGTLSVLLNMGQQQFLDAGRIPVGQSPVIADVGDINGDGVFDVAVTATDEISVALGRGDGNFDPAAHYPSPGIPWATLLRDWNGDGMLDMLVSKAWDLDVEIWLNDGTGAFFMAESLYLGGGAFGMRTVDIDGNGTLDLLVAHSEGLGVVLGDGRGGGVLLDPVKAGTEPRSVAVADFDNDGRLDAALANAESDDVSLQIGDGTGRFEHVATYAVGELPSGIESGDFNSDGVPDIAVSNQLGNSVGLILSNP